MALLKHRSLNGWGLFSLVVAPLCLAVLVAAANLDLSDPLGVSAMITFSVRLAAPWLYVAFAASALAVLFPGRLSRWTLRNRRIFGLCFAAGMAWQLFFIVWLVGGHFDYYMKHAYSFFSLVEQVPGYIVLAAMTLTSFRFGRRRLTAKQWKRLHRGGIYFLWFVVWTTYWYELFYYDDIQPIDYLYYWVGFAAWAVRMAAWTAKRLRRPAV